MKYQILNGTVSLKGETVLNHIDFEIRGKEKIAVVGKNGAGKTTLLRLIAGEISLDRDDKCFSAGVVVEKNTTIGILHQGMLSETDHTVAEEILDLCPVKDINSKERYDFEREYDQMFTGFGFIKEDKKKKIKEFSGGEQTKIAMIKLLLQKPDILLLDEPTNHLDVQTVEWLEEYIRQYPKAVVVVSHDRFFLDRIVNVVYELDQGVLTRYVGNYSAYREQREKKRKVQWKNYIAQQKEIERLTALIEKFKHKPKKAAMARSKKKMLERMDRIKRPDIEDFPVFVEKIVPNILGSKWVLDANKLCIGYDTCLQEITFRLRRGQKIGIIGANGTGKTTWFRTIIGQISPISGTIQLGNHVELGYFDQHSGELNCEKRVFEYFHDAHPSLTVKETKQILGKYLFRGDDTGKKVSELSGGEKSRLILAEILESRPNLLLLDEPTNHMDIPAKEALESAFQAYTGTMLFISHDRYFLKKIADALLIFESDGVKYYPFGYEHYVEHLRKKREFGTEMDVVAVENTRLLQELQEVPEKTRMQSARFSTEQSFADWQLELAKEQLLQAQKKIEDFLKSSMMEEKKEWKREEGQNILQQWEMYCKDRRQQYEKYLEDYTEKCLIWYEKWENYETAFANYKEDS